MLTGVNHPLTPAPAMQRDIVFKCQHCATPLVVDRAAAGMTLTCQRCTKPTTVPHPQQTEGVAAANASNEQLSEVRRQLKENESQRTEITSYINQLSIQLHRWQLRLQTLNERKQQLENEINNSH